MRPVTRPAPGSIRRYLKIVSVALVFSLLATACRGSGASEAQDPTGLDGWVDHPATAQQIADYGYAPDPGLDYQPDVVVVRGGPSAVRWVSGDGLTWALDAQAPGASDLSTGVVMFVTTYGLGRVMERQDHGDEIVVTLAPVTLEEVFENLVIDLDQALDFSQFTFQVMPDLPGVMSEPSLLEAGTPGADATSHLDEEGSPIEVVVEVVGEDSPVENSHGGLEPTPLDPTLDEDIITLPAINLVAVPISYPGGALPANATSLNTERLGDGEGAGSSSRERDSKMPPARKVQPSLKIGAWTVSPSASSTELGLELGGEHKSLTLAVGVTFPLKNPRLVTSAKVAGGVMPPGTILFHGIEGLKVSIAAGIGNWALDNEKAKLEIPMNISWPIPPSPATGGVPLAVKFSLSFLVSTALSGDNTTLQGEGIYSLSGPIGIRAGEIVSPTFTVEQGILDSLGGIMLGPSGIVVGMKLKAQVGIGIPTAMVGPHIALTTSLGVTHGSTLGASLITCRSGSLTMTLAGGVGISLAAGIVGRLARLFGDKVKSEFSVEGSTEIFKRTAVVPDSPICRVAS